MYNLNRTTICVYDYDLFITSKTQKKKKKKRKERFRRRFEWYVPIAPSLQPKKEERKKHTQENTTV